MSYRKEIKVNLERVRKLMAREKLDAVYLTLLRVPKVRNRGRNPVVRIGEINDDIEKTCAMHV